MQTVGCLFRQLNSCLGELFVQVDNQFGGQKRPYGWRGRNNNRSGGTVVCDLTLNIVDQRKDFFGLSVKDLAGLSQAGHSALSIKKRYAQFLFQFANLLTKSGLGDVACSGSPRKVSVLNNF